MASDASIKRVEELGLYSSHLQGFCDSLVKNGTSFSNLMMQKLQNLRSNMREADDIVQKLREAELEAERQLAYRNDDSDLGMLQQRYVRIHDKLTTARRLQSEIRSKISGAQGVVMFMTEQTREFQNDIKQQIEGGRQMLKKAAVQLADYKETVKKL